MCLQTPPPPQPLTPAFPELKIIVQSFSALVLHILVGFYHITQYINTLNFEDQADNDMIKCNIQNKKLFTSLEGPSPEDCSRASSARLLPAGPKKPTVNLPLFFPKASSARLFPAGPKKPTVNLPLFSFC